MFGYGLWTVAQGLQCTIDEHSSLGKIIGFLLITAFASGFTFQTYVPDHLTWQCTDRRAPQRAARRTSGSPAARHGGRDGRDGLRADARLDDLARDLRVAREQHAAGRGRAARAVRGAGRRARRRPDGRERPRPPRARRGAARGRPRGVRARLQARVLHDGGVYGCCVLGVFVLGGAAPACA